MKSLYLFYIPLICLSSLISLSAIAIDTIPTELSELKSLSNDELTELYSFGSAFTIPSAESPEEEILYKGIPLPTPGFPGPSELLNFFWGGKVFYTDQTGKTTLTNQVLPTTPISFNNVSADVYIENESLTSEGDPVVLLDYSNSNIAIARGIRDEIRLVSPGIYLGRAYMKNGFLTRLLTDKEYSFVLWFALEEPN